MARPPPTEKSLKNLKPAPAWKKGQSGNPKGYPKGQKNRATILKELLELSFKDPKGKLLANPFDAKEKKLTIEKAIDIVLIQKALKGDLNAIREIKDTIHGKISDKTEITGADGGPVQISEVEITFVRPK